MAVATTLYSEDTIDVLEVNLVGPQVRKQLGSCNGDSEDRLIVILSGSGEFIVGSDTWITCSQGTPLWGN